MKSLEVLGDKKGFTLIELLLVIGITVILVVAVSPVYTNLQVSSQLNDTNSRIVQNLRTARERSVSRMNGKSHGIYLEVDRFTLYQGSSFAARDSAYDREILLDDSLSISSSLSGMGDIGDVNFSKGLGVPNKTGTSTLSHSVGGDRVVVINSFGVIDGE